MSILGAGAGVTAQGKTPENARQPEDNCGGNDQVQHQPAGLSERFDEQSRWNICNDHDRNDPAENESKNPRKNYVRIARNVEKIEVAVNQALGPDDPKTHGREAKHDRVMHSDAEPEGGQIKQDRQRIWDEAEPGERYANDDATERGVDHAVEAKLFGRNRKLAVDGQNEQRVELSGAHKLGNTCDVDEKESLEKLRDHLVRADEQHHFPFRPIANAIDLAKNDAEENDLPAEPEDFDDHPKEEVGFETHLADERIAQHDGVDVDVTPHYLFLSLVTGEVNLHLHETLFPAASHNHRLDRVRVRPAPMSTKWRRKLSDGNRDARSADAGGHCNWNAKSCRQRAGGQPGFRKYREVVCRF